MRRKEVEEYLAQVDLPFVVYIQHVVIDRRKPTTNNLK